jgi:lysophospholipase L1-like esterase
MIKLIPLFAMVISWSNSLTAKATPNPDPARFSNAIATFEKEDAGRKPVADLTLFTGSSSIRMWKSLPTDFPDRKVLNRGFGGSHISDVLHYFDIVVARHKPKTIVLYCGENDLWSGKPPKQVFTDFLKFVRRVQTLDCKTKIHYLAAKPSPKRFEKWDIYQTCNSLISDHSAKDKRLHFVDVSKVMLGKSGQPLPDIWLKDKLHMNAAGYASWVKLFTHIFSK